MKAGRLVSAFVWTTHRDIEVHAAPIKNHLRVLALLQRDCQYLTVASAYLALDLFAQA
jgi:hypothetical protein